LKVENLIKHYKAVIDDGLKNFDKNAKGAIPSVVDCCSFEKDKPESSSQAR
jgi:hypothetical protein